jgi:hypothetical protein
MKASRVAAIGRNPVFSPFMAQRREMREFRFIPWLERYFFALIQSFLLRKRQYKVTGNRP